VKWKLNNLLKLPSGWIFFTYLLVGKKGSKLIIARMQKIGRQQ